MFSSWKLAISQLLHMWRDLVGRILQGNEEVRRCRTVGYSMKTVREYMVWCQWGENPPLRGSKKLLAHMTTKTTTTTKKEHSTGTWVCIFKIPAHYKSLHIITKWESMKCDVVGCEYALQISLDCCDNTNLVRIALKHSRQRNKKGGANNTVMLTCTNQFLSPF